MANEQKKFYTNCNTREQMSDFHHDTQTASGVATSMSEPMTPPASVHSGAIYASQHYPPHPKSLAPKSQYSPNVAIREQYPPSYAFGSVGSASLASPVDAPLYSLSLQQQQQQQQQAQQQQPSYLSTPHTPFSSNAADSNPTTPKAGRPLSMGSVRHVGGGSSGSVSSTGSGSIPAATPLGHTRSYSYNLRDRQNALSRLSISSTTSTNSSIPEREQRPRAYSSGLASAPVPFATPIGHAPGVAHSPLEVPGTHYPFPPPLSSPVSPDNYLAMSGRLAQRPHQYTHSFASSFDEAIQGSPVMEPVAPTRSGLHRSLSAISTLSGSSGNGLGGHVPTLQRQFEDVSEPGSIGVAPASVFGRRPSPPNSRGHRQRRSSSGASSSSMLDIPILGTGPSAVGNAGVAPGAGAGPAAVVGSAAAAGSGSSTSSSTAASKGLSNANIDVATADDQQIYSLCKDQRGCRFLQRKLGEGDPQVVRRVFGATKAHIVSLMMDPFGNYLCQKLLEYCSPDEITQLLVVASSSLPNIAVNQHGTRALQKLIDAVTKPEQADILVEALDGHVVRLIRDLNGNHVIQKLLLDLDTRGSQFIYDAVCQSVIEIGSHRHGCCVLQRCLDYAQDHNRNNLVSNIVSKSLVLVCDPFGNYVCQYVIDLGIQRYTDSLVQQLLGQISTLSVQKFSSNVVEKCLRSASPELQRAMIAEIMMPRTLHELLLDNYGNYVIQTALESSASLDMATKQQLSESIQAALTTTRSPYGRRVMSKLKSW